MVIPNENELIPIVKKLQEIMRIQDWDIELKYVSAIEMVRLGEDIDTIGLCTRDLQHRMATIRLSKDMYETGEVVGGWYSTLVHELYHVVISNFDETFVQDDAQSLQKEILVNNLAKVFCNIYPSTNFI